MALEAEHGVSGRHATIEERRRVVAESLRIGNPANHANDLPVQADPRRDCHIELNVDQIHPYEHNPRRAANAKFMEIKESIRASGIRNPLTVTRRPGDEHFIVEAGGNTRLLAIQELWAETCDARFQKLTVLFRPWRSESHVLTAHLIENEQRGEMTFWDKANGVVALKAELEAEHGRSLSLKQLEEELKRIGMSVNTAAMSHYLFATERLRTLGEAVTGLTGLDVRTMQPRLNVLKRYAQQHGPISEASLYAAVFEPIFRCHGDRYRQTLTFSASAVCEACEEALAEHLHEPVTQLRNGILGAAHPPSVSADHLAANRVAPPVDVQSVNDDPAADDTGAVDNAGSLLAHFEERHASSDAPVRSGSAESAVGFRLAVAVQRFADLSGIADCPRLDPAALDGDFTQASPAPADDDFPLRLKHRAQQLLALIYQQINGGSGHDRLDDSCEALRSTDAETDTAKLVVFDAGFLAWLLDTRDEAAGAFWQIVTLVREIRGSAPSTDLLAGQRSEKTRSA